MEFYNGVMGGVIFLVYDVVFGILLVNYIDYFFSFYIKQYECLVLKVVEKGLFEFIFQMIEGFQGMLMVGWIFFLNVLVSMLVDYDLDFFVSGGDFLLVEVIVNWLGENFFKGQYYF